MLYLSLIEHTLRLPPHLLHLPFDEAVTAELETLLIDKVCCCCVQVILVYHSIPVEQPENSKPFAPMLITVRNTKPHQDGLGSVSWWEEAEILENES
ncbi:NUCLEAR RNA POLYMERASE C, SUBUNIT 7 [Hibiscus trionum]|uniref:NUCLEAR RNA POLYMERASE C, SUBUNIT 7 n=1 Tax=Hibiscus trionum TaxID=183268 RepID=A0A9W7ILE2_HIBTR|nr:NUCLEAR RNA POLYMERASE C, SUBUNIT 7 [Hibiscus trionum]